MTHTHHHHHRDHHGNPKDFAAYVKRLEDPSRDVWQQTPRLLKALGFVSGQTVAEIGAGPGYIALKIAKKLGPAGRMLAVDVEPRMLEVLAERIQQARAKNITPILGLSTTPLLPLCSCDHALMVNAFHHLRAPVPYLKALHATLKKRGRLTIVDFHKRESPMGPPLEERVSRDRCVADAAKAKLTLVGEQTFLEHQYVLTFAPAR